MVFCAYFNFVIIPEFIQVWRDKNVLKPSPGKRSCNCRNEVYQKPIGPGMYQLFTQRVIHLLSIYTYLLTKSHPFLKVHMVISSMLILFFQVCQECQNVKYAREGKFITVDIEKGMHDGQVERLCTSFFFVCVCKITIV